MKQTQTIPETFLGVGYTRDRAGLPLEALRVPVPQPAADEVLIRVAASSLNPLEYKLADLNSILPYYCIIYTISRNGEGTWNRIGPRKYKPSPASLRW
jgi:hypothetical protein